MLSWVEHEKTFYNLRALVDIKSVVSRERNCFKPYSSFPIDRS